MKIDELERLVNDAADGKEEMWCYWHNVGPLMLPHKDANANSELVAAARNALPALLRVARAARELEEILATVAADADAADVLVMRRHAARAELRAALAALEGAPDA
jgi:hypothetical protein